MKAYKAYIITCTVIVIASIGFRLYIRYDTQKFIGSLPKVPSKEEMSSSPRNDSLLQSRTEQGFPNKPNKITHITMPHQMKLLKH
ncbi:hypothetical protein JT359_00170 [Candidatus Poribacteria bacterium]|nr:hypothetical protein [Candidatus Poribacteria bacterium]